MLGTGLFTSLTVGYLLAGRRHALLPAFRAHFLAAAISALLFLATFRPHGSGYLLAAAGVLGAFAVPMLPLALESAAESFYPATEDVSSGLLTIAGKAFGVVALFCLQPLFSQSSCASVFSPAAGFIGASLAVASSFFVLFKTQLKRLQAEESIPLQI